MNTTTTTTTPGIRIALAVGYMRESRAASRLYGFKAPLTRSLTATALYHLRLVGDIPAAVRTTTARRLRLARYPEVKHEQPYRIGNLGGPHGVPI